MRDSVRIVIVGDEKVGKTSIIEVLISEEFPEREVPPVLPVLVVPKDVTPDQCHVSIVDTPGDPARVSVVNAELNQADVIVLVYAVDDDESTDRVISHWLPKFRSMDLKVPIVLVGNKIDTRGGVADPEAAAKMEAFIKPIMDRFREVDVCIECSARTVSNISEVFYFAQKAVLYPTGPVYDVETQALRPRATAALRRIFKLCDKDGDGGLNDVELNDFQHTCFNVRLQPAEIDGVKRVVRENCPDDGLRADDSLSVTGFIFLHTLFVQKGRLETTWIVLRKFGYDDDMRLRIEPSDLPQGVGADQVIELSDDCEAFLRGVFEGADMDKDGLLAPEELSKVFVECSDGPFAEAKLRNGGLRLVGTADVRGRSDYMSWASFKARWATLAAESPEDALRCLVHLGYDAGSMADALRPSRPRRRDRHARTVTRSTVHVGVFGDAGAMKTDVIRGLAGNAPQWVDVQGLVAAAQLLDGSASSDDGTTPPADKTLVLRYVSVDEERELVSAVSSASASSSMVGVGGSTGAGSSAGGVGGGGGSGNNGGYLVSLEQLDVVCIVFDVSSHDSFAHGVATWQALRERKEEVKVPVVFVGAYGSDHDKATEEEDASSSSRSATTTTTRSTATTTTTGAGAGAAEPAALKLADAFCLEQGLPTPTRVSIADAEFGKLYDDLLGVALYPQVACADYYDDVAAADSATTTIIRVSAGLLVLGATVYGAKKLYDYVTGNKNESGSSKANQVTAASMTMTE